MYEFHGWATIWVSTAEDDDHLLHKSVEEIRTLINSLHWPSGLVDLRITNGSYHLSTSGYRNHKDSVVTELFALYYLIAKVAPGSYGILYIWDDEDPSNENAFIVYVLRRGLLSLHKDPFLSPRIPIIEDP